MDSNSKCLHQEEKYKDLNNQLEKTKKMINCLIEKDNPFGFLTPEISIRIQIINNSPYEVFNLKINNKKYIQFLSFRSATPVIKLPKKIFVSLYKIGGKFISSFSLDLKSKKDYILIINGVIDSIDFPFHIKCIETSFDLDIMFDFQFMLLNGIYHNKKSNKLSISSGVFQSKEIEYGNFSELYKLKKSDIEFFNINYQEKEILQIPLLWFMFTFIQKSCFIFSSGYLLDEKEGIVLSVFTDGTVILLPNKDTTQIITKSLICEEKKENKEQTEKNENNDINKCNYSKNIAKMSDLNQIYELPGILEEPKSIYFLYNRYNQDQETPSYCYSALLFNNEYVDSDIYFKLNILDNILNNGEDCYLILNNKNPIKIIFGKKWFINIDPIFSVKMFVTWNTEDIKNQIENSNNENNFDNTLNISDYSLYFDNSPSFINEIPGERNIYQREKGTQIFISKNNNVDIQSEFNSVFSHYINSENVNSHILVKVCFWNIYISVKIDDLEYTTSDNNFKLFQINIKNNSVEFIIKSNIFYFNEQNNENIIESRKKAFLDINLTNNYYKKIPIIINYDKINNKYINSIEISKDNLHQKIDGENDNFIQTYFNNWFNTFDIQKEIFVIYGLNTKLKN